MTGVAGCCARIESGATTMAVPIKLIKHPHPIMIAPIMSFPISAARDWPS